MPFIIDARNMGGGSIGSAAGGDTSTGTRNNVTLAAPWDESKGYLKGDLATNNGDLYQAQKSVPAGIKISDEDYWALVVAGDKAKETEKLRKDIGSLGDLETDSKDSLVAAINEAARSGGGSKDAVLYTGQALTDEQKAQARKNIGAAGVFYVTVTFNESTQKYESDMGISKIAELYEKSNLIPVLKVKDKFNELAYNLYKLVEFRCNNRQYSMLFVCSYKQFNEARPYMEIFDLNQNGGNTDIFHKEVRGVIEDDLSQFIKINKYSYGYPGAYNGSSYSEIVANPQKYPVATVENNYDSEVQSKFKGIIFPLETITENEVIYSVTAADSQGAKCIKKGLRIPKTGNPVLIDKEISLPANSDILNSITGVVTADKLFDPDHPTDLVAYEAFRAAVPLVQSMGITGAQVGQTIKVKAVNEQGMPTAWEAAAGESYTLPEATSDALGGVKADPATTSDTQPIRIGTDGKLVTAPAAVSDTQVSSAVSTWLTEHPEATTTVADGAVTGQKLSDDLYKQITGDSRHKLTEVKIDLHYIKYNAWEEQPSAGGMRATNIFPTPQYIKIVSHTSDFSVSETMKIHGIRFLADAEGTADSSGLERNVYFLRDEVPDDETVIMPTFEYDRVGAGYMQLRFVLTNWQKPMGLFDVYAIYDTWRPTYTLPDDTGEFVYDLPVQYLYNGENDSTYVKLWGIVPYYPGTTYNIRGGYYATVLTKELNVAYLLDDSIFTTWDDGILAGSSGRATLGAIPLYKGIHTTQYDTSVNGGANAAYQWAYVTTPPESELIGPKWVAIVMGNHVQDEKGNKGAEYYSSLLAAIEAKGVQNMYITRFDKQVPRSLYAQLAFPNPDYHDDGSKYYAMLTSASKSPLVGAKWTLFGDSLTDNYGGHDLTGSYFATKIAREFNMSFDNRAKSGSNIYRGGSGNYTSVSGMIKLDEFTAEIDAGTTEQPDYITIAFGTNSFTAQLGTNADTSATDTSVYGATKRFIEVLREKCPKSVFGFVLSPKQNWGSSDPYNLRAVDAARTAIKAVCDEYGAPYIDMSTQSGITVDMLPDGIHISNDQSQNLYYHAMRRFMIGL